MTVQNVDGKCIDIGGATGMTGSSSAGAGGSSDGSSTAAVVSVPDAGGESCWRWVMSVESVTLVVRVVGQ
jgi:hypothetical protein